MKVFFLSNTNVHIYSDINVFNFIATDAILQTICSNAFLTENTFILIKKSLKFVPKYLIWNESALARVMTWHLQAITLINLDPFTNEYVRQKASVS